MGFNLRTAIFFLNVTVEIDRIAILQGDDSLLKGISAALDETGLGVASLVLTGIAAGGDSYNRYIVQGLNFVLDLNLVSLRTHDEAELILLLGDFRHLLSDEGFDNVSHSCIALYLLRFCSTTAREPSVSTRMSASSTL